MYLISYFSARGLGVHQVITYWTPGPDRKERDQSGATEGKGASAQRPEPESTGEQRPQGGSLRGQRSTPELGETRKEIGGLIAETLGQALETKMSATLGPDTWGHSRDMGHHFQRQS